MTTVQVSIDAVAENTTYEVNGEEFYKMPSQQNTRGSFPEDVLENIRQAIRDTIGRIRVESINSGSGRFRLGSLIGVQISRGYRTTHLRVMVKKDNTINLTQVRNKIAQLQAEDDRCRQRSQEYAVRYEEERAALASLRNKLNVLHAYNPYRLFANAARYEVTEYRHEHGFAMKLQALTDEQVMFIADIVNTWNTK